MFARTTPLTIVACFALACASSPPAALEGTGGSPPASVTEAVRGVVETLHGHQIHDPHRWLENETSPEVQSWMKQQDALAREQLGRVPQREAIAARLRELSYRESVTAPVQRGGRLFYLKTHKNTEKAILYWRKGESGPEKVLLDPNRWSPDGTVSLGRWEPSWDGKKVAFQRKPNAADEAILHVVDVDTAKWSDRDIIDGAKYATVDWAPDNRSFYYEWLPTDPSIPVSERPGYTELRHHRLGTDQERDIIVHPKTGDPKTFLRGSLSRDGKYLFAYVARGWAENDVYWRRVDSGSEFRPLVLGRGAKYDVLAWDDLFYVLTDEGAPLQRVFRVSPEQPEREHWKPLIAEDPAAALVSMSIVGGHLALAYLKNATTELRLATPDGRLVRTVKLPQLGSASNLVGLEEEDTAYFEFSSFTVPSQIYRHSVRTGATKLWHAVKLPIKPSEFQVEQVWFESKDKTRVPMFVVHKKGLARDGSAPALLYGYGGFNISLTPEFRSTIYPWIEAGGVYAVPNLRGGGEFGKAWHDAGRLGRKQNVFDDFIAAAEYLVRERYTSPSRLAIRGGSNGGLLVGAAMTQRPNLFGAVVCSVPLLDMLRYHLFGSGRTWIPEYGTAENEADFSVLRAYSPYHAVNAKTAYPPLLMMSADRDDRVDPMHARKFVAAIQAAHPSGTALLRVERNAGHRGADQVKKTVDAYADEYAFLFSRLMQM